MQQGLVLSLKMLCAGVGAGYSRWGTIQCLFSEPLNSLCNTVGEFQVLARAYLKSPGQSHEVSRNVLTCVLVVGFFFLIFAVSADGYKRCKNEVFSCWRGMLKRCCQF